MLLYLKEELISVYEILLVEPLQLYINTTIVRGLTNEIVPPKLYAKVAENVQ